MKQQTSSIGSEWDHTSKKEFVDYYAKESLSIATRERFVRLRDKILRRVQGVQNGRRLAVLDVGCNTGTQCLVWAELGHKVYGLDVSEQFLELARERTGRAGC